MRHRRARTDGAVDASEHKHPWLRISGFNRTGMPDCVLYLKAGVGRLCSGGLGLRAGRSRK